MDCGKNEYSNKDKRKVVFEGCSGNFRFIQIKLNLTIKLVNIFLKIKKIKLYV